jgi:uncharacterized protein YbgA (DUF1722 family)
MQEWANGRLDELAGEHLCGFIFKKNSPSSGMQRVRVYNERGMPSKIGVGIFAGAFMARFPLMPVEDEGRLHDPALREHFIESVFTLKRWREFLSSEPKTAGLVDFHSRNKLLLMSHSPLHLRDMGRLVATANEIPVPQLIERYQVLLMESLKLKATRKKNVNVIHHVLGYFKKVLTGDEKKELIEIIDGYLKRLIPLIVPITLLSHYVRKFDQPYLRDQTYLNPHQLELCLRYHA